MTSKERIKRQVLGQEVDRIPTVGGWMLSAGVLAEFAGVSVEAFLADAAAMTIRAYKNLGADALVGGIIVPSVADQVRAGQVEEAKFSQYTPEDLVKRAEKAPASEQEFLAKVDRPKMRADYANWIGEQRKSFDGMELIPTFWHVVPNFMMYCSYGYEAYLAACAMYPDHVERIYWESAIDARSTNSILVDVYRDLDLPPILFTGHDMCINTGTMVSPAFLRQRYWPLCKNAIEPLVEAGIRVIYHCDGNVMPIIDDIIAAGFSGFQGFQYEYGVDPFAFSNRRSTSGQEFLYMTGMNISRTLPWGTPADVREELEYVLDYTAGGRQLLLFSSNVIGPEVPAANVKAAYDFCRNYNPNQPRPTAGKARPWPWGAKHA